MSKRTYRKLFTSESVGAGHPDKICDQISDTILDKIMEQDPNSRVAIECIASNRLIVIGGELTTKAYVDFVKAAWEVLIPLGYNTNDFTIISNVNSQSPDINQGVDRVKEEDMGAGDQGLVFGYANSDTEELMPLPITLAHRLAERAETLRREGKFLWAKSDLKTQVTIDYSGEKPRIDTLLMSVQHDANFDEEAFKKFIRENIMEKVAKEYGLNTDYKIFINPTGRFVIGGPIGDTGLTGRKIIVDSYGGMGRHGGGAFSGKDYTKVDRSGAYAARWVAKNIVAAGLASEVEVQIAYAIGVAQPVSIAVETFGTSTVSNDIIENAVKEVFKLTPYWIIKQLNLKRPIYLQTSTFGHFGKSQLPWEQTNKVDELLAKVEELKK